MELVEALGVNSKGKHLFCKLGGFSLGFAGDFFSIIDYMTFGIIPRECVRPMLNAKH